jgi:hypothetical protein
MNESICIDYNPYWLKDQDKNKYNNKSQYACNAWAIGKNSRFQNKQMHIT